MGLFAGTPWDRPPTCDRCQKLESDCQCPPEQAASRLKSPESQTARLAIEKRKKGKVVTVIRGLSADGNDLAGLLVRFKNSCGAGGSIDGDVLEIQGDHLDRLQKLLLEAGFKVKRST